MTLLCESWALSAGEVGAGGRYSSRERRFQQPGGSSRIDKRTGSRDQVVVESKSMVVVDILKKELFGLDILEKRKHKK